MRKEIITAVSQDGLDNCTSVFVFTVYDESIDLIEKIKEAAAAFINTDTGLLEYQHNCENFNWGDFFSAVPNSFLRPYGFEKDTSDVAQQTVNFDEQLATEGDYHFSDEKWEILKRELFMNGTEALEEFLGNDIDENLEKDSIENMLDEVAGQMPDEELYKFYSKYCLERQVLCEQRKQQLIKAIEDADTYNKDIKMEELQFDEYEKSDIILADNGREGKLYGYEKEPKMRLSLKYQPVLQNFYFTFGTDPKFPYQKGYLIVKAFNLNEAFAKFRAKYADVHPNCLNCAFWYTQEQWDVIDGDMGKCHEVIE